MRPVTTRRLGVLTTLLGAAGAVFGLGEATASAVVGPEVAPIVLAQSANLDCTDVEISVHAGGQTWLEIDTAPADGTTGPITITNFDAAARTFDWTSTIGIDAVYVKGGAGGAHLYVYAPTAQSPESFGDDGLTTPGTTGNGISHMSFCYDTTDPTTTTSTTSTTVPEETTSTTSTTVPEETTTTSTTSTTVPEETTTTSTTSTTSTTVPEETTTSTTSTTAPGVGASSSTTTPRGIEVLGQQQRQLPRTGGDTGGLVLLSLGVIVIGLGLIALGDGARVLAVRRR